MVKLYLLHFRAAELDLDEGLSLVGRTYGMHVLNAWVDGRDDLLTALTDWRRVKVWHGTGEGGKPRQG